MSAAILLGVLWWRWNRGWEDLESGLQEIEKTSQGCKPQAHVPADVMEKLVTHRVDPDYPAAARPANLQGVIVLDVVVGRDGSVVDVHAKNGPDVLAQAAMDAMRWWRFEALSRGGSAGGCGNDRRGGVQAVGCPACGSRLPGFFLEFFALLPDDKLEALV